MTPGGSAGRLVMTFSSSSGGRGSSPVGPGGQDCDEAGCGHAPMRSGPGPAGDFITAAGRADRSRQRHRAAGRGKGQTRPAAAHPYSQSRTYEDRWEPRAYWLLATTACVLVGATACFESPPATETAGASAQIVGVASLDAASAGGDHVRRADVVARD